MRSAFFSSLVFPKASAPAYLVMLLVVLNMQISAVKIWVQTCVIYKCFGKLCNSFQVQWVAPSWPCAQTSSPDGFFEPLRRLPVPVQACSWFAEPLVAKNFCISSLGMRVSKFVMCNDDPFKSVCLLPLWWTPYFSHLCNVGDGKNSWKDRRPNSWLQIKRYSIVDLPGWISEHKELNYSIRKGSLQSLQSVAGW